MKYLQVTVFTLLIGLCVLAFGNAQAATYYVSTSGGSDGNPGTISSPWKTIAKANGVLVAGDTVYLRAGTYSEPIAPKNSGSAGNYVTYSNYQGETVTMNYSSGVQAALGGHSYIVINGLKFINANASWIDMTGTTYSIVQNCIFNGANTWGGLYMESGSNYNKILNNSFNSTCNASTATGGPKDHIWIEYSSFNLFDGNTFGNAPHVAIDIIGRGAPDQNQKNIIRNNTFNNQWHTNLNIYDGAGRTLIENNVVLNAGLDAVDNYCGSDADRTGGIKRQHALDLQAVDSIIRNNVFYNNGNFMLQSKPETNKYAINNRIFNNTIYGGYYNFYINSVDAVYGNEVKNNIIDKATSNEVLVTIGSGVESDNYFLFNDITGSSIIYKSASGTYSSIQSAYPSEWQKNMGNDPAFTNVSKQDFHLTSNSPAINAGSFLTTTTTSGSGTTITVKDARYFTDGWGLVDGDMIQLQGQTTQAKVLNIDYTNNVITVDRALTWSAGLGVSLPYSGSAPDLGALEYNVTPTPTQPSAPQGLKVMSVQ